MVGMDVGKNRGYLRNFKLALPFFTVNLSSHMASVIGIAKRGRRCTTFADSACNLLKRLTDNLMQLFYMLSAAFHKLL